MSGGYHVSTALCQDCGCAPEYRGRRVTCKRCLGRFCKDCFRENGHTRKRTGESAHHDLNVVVGLGTCDEKLKVS